MNDVFGNVFIIVLNIYLGLIIKYINIIIYIYIMHYAAQPFYGHNIYFFYIYYDEM